MIKKIYIVPIIVLVIILIVYFGFLRKGKREFSLVEVKRGTLSQEISETGQVQKGENFNLAFKNTGIIEKIYVEAGDKVKAGQELASLDITDFYLQLQEARISLESAQLNLKKLLAGASLEEIKIAQTQVESGRSALDIAKENLNNIYETAMTVLDNSYPPIYNALDFVKKFITNYVATYDLDGIKITLARDKIEKIKEETYLYLEIAKNDLKNENTELTLSLMKNSLETVFNNLETIREIIDSSAVYRNNVSATDKTSLDTLKTNINSALANVIGAQQTISLMKLNVEAAEKKLQEAKNNLDLVKAETRQVDIDLYEAQIKQAETRVKFYENQLQQSKLFSPVDGQIIKINKKVGETVQPAIDAAVIILSPAVPFEIEVDIYEEDVVKMNVGNPVEISLVAFPDKTFKGKVRAIEPAEKLIGEVVYYEATVDFDEMPEDLKPGMSADLVIKTASKENVLLVSSDAMQKKDGKTIVEVFKNGKTEQREIQIGLRGSQGTTEIISGLTEGEKVILK